MQCNHRHSVPSVLIVSQLHIKYGAHECLTRRNDFDNNMKEWDRIYNKISRECDQDGGDRQAKYVYSILHLEFQNLHNTIAY
jgi:hypothetical protein